MQKLRSILKKDKRGVVGLDIAKSVFLVLATLAVLGFVVIILMNSLATSGTLTAGTLAANQSNAVFANVSGGISTFFGNTGTWLSLLAVVIIIAIIALVLFFVNRFGGSKGGV